MSLTTLGMGFAAVAILFLAAGWLGAGRKLSPGAAAALLLEALTLSLLGTLWFASLGRGGWVLVFGLIAVLRFAFLRSLARSEVVPIGVGIGRYLLAGALLAWLIG